MPVQQEPWPPTQQPSIPAPPSPGHYHLLHGGEKSARDPSPGSHCCSTLQPARRTLVEPTNDSTSPRAMQPPVASPPTGNRPSHALWPAAPATSAPPPLTQSLPPPSPLLSVSVSALARLTPSQDTHLKLFPHNPVPTLGSQLRYHLFRKLL